MGLMRTSSAPGSAAPTRSALTCSPMPAARAHEPPPGGSRGLPVARAPVDLGVGLAQVDGRELRRRHEVLAERPGVGQLHQRARRRVGHPRVAQLEATGLPNREIGQRLYLSHRTISTHLYRVFPKLGITSRAELSAALASGAQPRQ